MHTVVFSKRVLSGLAAALSVVVLSGPVWAEKPDWAGQGGKGGGHKGGKNREEASTAVPVVDRYFGDAQRDVIRSYFQPQVQAGKCPPGLAKKGNGCLPPGQAKQWAKGRRLGSDVAWYPLPADLERRLGRPPEGHRFVRVAADILLIAVGTQMVVDAIEDLAGR